MSLSFMYARLSVELEAAESALAAADTSTLEALGRIDVLTAERDEAQARVSDLEALRDARRSWHVCEDVREALVRALRYVELCGHADCGWHEEICGQDDEAAGLLVETLAEAGWEIRRSTC